MWLNSVGLYGVQFAIFIARLNLIYHSTNKRPQNSPSFCPKPLHSFSWLWRTLSWNFRQRFQELSVVWSKVPSFLVAMDVSRAYVNKSSPRDGGWSEVNGTIFAFTKDLLQETDFQVNSVGQSNQRLDFLTCGICWASWKDETSRGPGMIHAW